MANKTEMPIRPTFFATPVEFRNWLVEHHQDVREFWVGFCKKDSGKPSITWPESVDEALCVGCGKCVKGCALFGNGSLYLQVKQDLCVHCNECAIAKACPGDAYRRIPAEQAYLLKARPAGGSGQE